MKACIPSHEYQLLYLDDPVEKDFNVYIQNTVNT